MHSNYAPKSTRASVLFWIRTQRCTRALHTSVRPIAPPRAEHPAALTSSEISCFTSLPQTYQSSRCALLSLLRANIYVSSKDSPWMRKCNLMDFGKVCPASPSLKAPPTVELAAASLAACVPFCFTKGKGFHCLVQRLSKLLLPPRLCALACSRPYWQAVDTSRASGSLSCQRFSASFPEPGTIVSILFQVASLNEIQ